MVARPVGTDAVVVNAINRNLRFRATGTFSVKGAGSAFTGPASGAANLERLPDLRVTAQGQDFYGSYERNENCKYYQITNNGKKSLGLSYVMFKKISGNIIGRSNLNDKGKSFNLPNGFSHDEIDVAYAINSHESKKPRYETENEKINAVDDDLRIFIGGIYGESSVLNIFEEMAAIAAVLLRQRNARKRKTWTEFRNDEKSFAFALSDGNPRYKIVQDAEHSEFFNPANPLSIAYDAAIHAINNGTDFSNGAFFWDGPDLATQVSKKIGKANPKAGFHFTRPEHNIFGTGDYHIEHVKFKVTGSGKKKVKSVVAECSWAYESTAAFDGVYKIKTKSSVKEVHTGTVFWKFNEVFCKNFGSGKEYL